jgi:hypothetical protein
VQLAQEVEASDPIFWDHLAIDEDAAYRLIATSVLEKFQNSYSETDHITILAVITKLMVENMVLNLKLLQQGIM